MMEVRRLDGTFVVNAPVPSVAPGDVVDVALDLPEDYQFVYFDEYRVSVNPASVNDSETSNNTTGFTVYGFIDLDKDGIDDRLETFHSAFNPTTDLDGDGDNNLTESLSGKNSRNGGSRFDWNIVSEPTDDENVVVIDFDALFGKKSFIEASPDMSNWTNIPGTTFIAKQVDNAIEVVVDETTIRMFFRVTPVEP